MIAAAVYNDILRFFHVKMYALELLLCTKNEYLIHIRPHEISRRFEMFTTWVIKIVINNDNSIFLGTFYNVQLNLNIIRLHTYVLYIHTYNELLMYVYVIRF